jgi:conjugal transfer pilus assembly protein TraE
MDLSISHAQAQRLLKQRNLLAIGCAAVLFAVSVLLTLAAASRDREVVLQPVLAKPLTLSSSHIDKDYLELVTRDAALLTLNRSPSNLQYWMDSILAITDPRTHGRMKAELMKVFNEQNGSNVSQYFTIEKLSVDPEGADQRGQRHAAHRRRLEGSDGRGADLSASCGPTRA